MLDSNLKQQVVNSFEAYKNALMSEIFEAANNVRSELHHFLEIGYLNEYRIYLEGTDFSPDTSYKKIPKRDVEKTLEKLDSLIQDISNNTFSPHRQFYAVPSLINSFPGLSQTIDLSKELIICITAFNVFMFN